MAPVLGFIAATAPLLLPSSVERGLLRLGVERRDDVAALLRLAREHVDRAVEEQPVVVAGEYAVVEGLDLVGAEGLGGVARHGRPHRAVLVRALVAEVAALGVGGAGDGLAVDDDVAARLCVARDRDPAVLRVGLEIVGLDELDPVVAYQQGQHEQAAEDRDPAQWLVH